MTDIPEDDIDDEIIEELEGRCYFLEHTIQMLFIGMKSMEEVQDRLRAENAQLRAALEIGAKRMQ